MIELSTRHIHSSAAWSVHAHVVPAQPSHAHPSHLYYTTCFELHTLIFRSPRVICAGPQSYASVEFSRAICLMSTPMKVMDRSICFSEQKISYWQDGESLCYYFLYIPLGHANFNDTSKIIAAILCPLTHSYAHASTQHSWPCLWVLNYNRYRLPLFAVNDLVYCERVINSHC